MDEAKELKNKENDAKVYEESESKTVTSFIKKKGVSVQQLSIVLTQISQYFSVRWTTKPMAEEFDREELLKVTLREFIVYLIFVLIVTICMLKFLEKKLYYSRYFQV